MAGGGCWGAVFVSVSCVVSWQEETVVLVVPLVSHGEAACWPWR